MIAQGKQFIAPALLGNVAAIIGSVISVRLMLWQTKKFYGDEAMEPYAKHFSV